MMKIKRIEERVPFPNLPKRAVWAGSGPSDYIKKYLHSCYSSCGSGNHFHFVESERPY